ncbi:MAG: hypothetical protein KC431_09805, partial [Myxococcales bacterium]|nr:hypothetical protein [Myxococcales bacterium]
DTTDTGTDTGGDPLGERPVIYQLTVRHFGNSNQTRAQNGGLAQNGVGKFNDIDETAVAELVAMGFTHVWLTGVLRQATLTNYQGYGMPADDADVVRGRAGWIHAVRDNYDVSPDYAQDPTMRLQEFDALVDRLHAANLRVLIDLVPNHVSRGYHSVIEPDLDFGVDDDQSVFFAADNHFFYLPGESLSLSKPAWYNPPGFTFDGAYAPEDGSVGHTPRATGNDVDSAAPGAGDWYDTVKLNWGWDFVAQIGDYQPMPDTWAKFDAIVAYWQDRGVDGFRCDAADRVPVEAWTWLIDQARNRDPEVYFLGAAPGADNAALEALLDAGFDAVYHDAGYDTLKRIYQGAASHDDYATAMFAIDDDRRPHYAEYLENHEERRVASPVVNNVPADDSGFGSANAGYQLAPLAYLYGPGPILFYNGQEVGDPGAGAEGFGAEDGRTTLYDYWSLPELSKWVNEGAFDGGGLAPAQVALRDFYGDLLALSQDPSALGSRYWGLEYFNNPGMFPDCPAGFYSFARFETGSGRLMVVVANFTPFQGASGPIRLPQDLLDAAGLAGAVEVRQVLDESGSVDVLVTSTTADTLPSAGFSADLPDQRAAVYIIE